jgi:hypothetical protein
MSSVQNIKRAILEAISIWTLNSFVWLRVQTYNAFKDVLISSYKNNGKVSPRSSIVHPKTK